MINLLKGDFYKLKRSKSFYICTSICVGLIAFFAAYIAIDYASFEKLKEQVYLSTFAWIYLPFNETSFLPTFMPIFQAIFITMFVTSEYTSGTIKDGVSLGYSRTKIYLSKLITVSVGSIIMMLAAIFSTGLAAILIFGIYGSFSINDLLQLVRMAGISGLLFIGFAGIFLMVGTLVKNMGHSMAINICIVIFLGFIVSGAGDTVWGRIWLLMNFAPNAVPQPEIAGIKMAIAVALTYLTGCSCIGAFSFRKQDIK